MTEEPFTIRLQFAGTAGTAEGWPEMNADARKCGQGGRITAERLCFFSRGAEDEDPKDFVLGQLVAIELLCLEPLHVGLGFGR